MKNRRNHYRILHVQRDAPTEVIRSTYRTMMQKLKMHPDLGGDHTNAALVNEAFAVLSDPVSRAEYDAVFAADRDSSHVSATEAERRQGAHAASGEEAGGTEAHDTGSSTQLRSDEQCLFCLARCQPVQFRGPDDLCSNCDSPIYPAEQRRFEVDCQRAIARIPKRASASFLVGWPVEEQQNGSVHDISLSGMQLRTNDELSDGQIIMVSTGVLDAVARVVDIRQLAAEERAAWRVGLVFLTMKIHRLRGSFVSVEA